MSAGITKPGELGEIASEAIGDLIARSTGGNSVATYAEGASPLSWKVLAEGGWDLIGIEEDEAVPLRDLAAVAKVWGTACLQLPLITSIIAKRHSTVAQEFDGPVTLSLSSGVGQAGGLVPYGQLDGIGVLRSLDGDIESAQSEPDAFDILLKATRSDWTTTLSAKAAREFAVLAAAEAVGAASRMLDDGLAYVKERQQFGKPIGSFQAVKHHLANALIDLELADTAVIWASLHDDEAFRGALFALDRALSTAEIVLQAEGGMGFTWEMGLHFYMRRMVSSRDLVTALAVQHG